MVLRSNDRFLRELEQEFEEESLFESEFEEELGSPVLQSGILQSARFADDPVLQGVASGQLRLGRQNDSPYPVPIQSHGPAVRKVHQALIDLGYPLPTSGDDGQYGQETYQAVLAYKTHFNIRTASGYLDGIVGPRTMAHLDSEFPSGPLPACPMPYAPVASAGHEGGRAVSNFGVPWSTCNPKLLPGAGTCERSLPDSNTVSSENGGGIALPGLTLFYCINHPHIHLDFTATWIERLPPNQRSPQERNRSVSAPTYDVTFSGFRREGLIPGRRYVFDPTFAIPPSGTFGSLHFVTLFQSNRIFQVRYSISESP